MPWRLISFLTTLIVAAVFIGFNLENRCDVSLVFYTFQDVPIFVSLLFAFVAGALAVVPFFIGARIRRSSRAAAKASARKNGTAASAEAKDSSRDAPPRAAKIRARETPED